jgi:hypothetical protein
MTRRDRIRGTVLTVFGLGLVALALIIRGGGLSSHARWLFTWSEFRTFFLHFLAILFFGYALILGVAAGCLHMMYRYWKMKNRADTHGTHQT